VLISCTSISYRVQKRKSSMLGKCQRPVAMARTISEGCIVASWYSPFQFGRRVLIGRLFCCHQQTVQLRHVTRNCTSLCCDWCGRRAGGRCLWYCAEEFCSYFNIK
jgi:hypothetical protein